MLQEQSQPIIYMDLEGLTQEQLDLTLRLSDLLSMEDLTVAAAVLASFDWNIQSALKELQNQPIPEPVQRPIDESQPNAYSYDVQEEEQQSQENAYINYEYQNKLIDEKKKYFQEQHASLFSLKKTISQPGKELSHLQYHKLLANDSRAHREDYLLALMSKTELLCGKIIDSSPANRARYLQNRHRIETNRKFINNLYTTYQPKLNFTFGTFLLNLTRSYLQGKFLLVYIHSIAPQTQSSFKHILELVLRQPKIASVVNRHCITYGMFDNSDDYEILQKYIPLRNLPAFGLFRLDKSKKAEEFISSHNLSQKGIFLDWLAASTGIALSPSQLQGQHVEKQKKLKEQYEKKEEQKRKEEALLIARLQEQQQYSHFSNQRAQQDQLYAEIEKTYLQKRMLSKQQKQKQQQRETDLQQRIQSASKEVEPQASSQTIELKFRMPITGQSRSRRFLLSDPVQKCFTFVDCCCRDEFQERFSDFDIVQTHPQLSLQALRGSTLMQVFEGSRRENVIIRQKS